MAHIDKEVQQPFKRADLPDLEELAADVQKNLNIMHNVDLQFSVHKASGQIMVTVIDESTGKVVREIPPSEILELAAKMDEMVGMIFDQKG
jgi:flagellar protein FlaG